MMLPFCTGGTVGKAGTSFIAVVVALLVKAGLGGLVEGVFDPECLFSIEAFSAYSSNACESCLASSLRSSVHDLLLCFRLRGSPAGKADMVLLCGIICGRPFLGDLGEL